MTDFSRIFASSPMNATAARVVSRGGEHFTPNMVMPDHVKHWDYPPTTLPLPSPGKSFVDLTGTRFGRFRVVGYMGKRRDDRPAQWLVRCDCGDYETRSTKAIKRAAEGADRCYVCQYHERVKRGFGNPTVEHLRQCDSDGSPKGGNTEE